MILNKNEFHFPEYYISKFKCILDIIDWKQIQNILAVYIEDSDLHKSCLTNL